MSGNIPPLPKYVFTAWYLVKHKHSIQCCQIREAWPNYNRCFNSYQTRDRRSAWCLSVSLVTQGRSEYLLLRHVSARRSMGSTKRQEHTDVINHRTLVTLYPTYFYAIILGRVLMRKQQHFVSKPRGTVLRAISGTAVIETGVCKMGNLIICTHHQTLLGWWYERGM